MRNHPRVKSSQVALQELSYDTLQVYCAGVFPTVLNLLIEENNYLFGFTIGPSRFIGQNNCPQNRSFGTQS